MSYRVFLTDDASRDLEILYDYIDALDVPGKADYVLDQIEKCFSKLAETPERGAYPKELLTIGLREYREIFFKPYRIIFRIISDDVFIMLIADSLRDVQAVLQRRLLQV
jgi:toxin ParE1/3/4